LDKISKSALYHKFKLKNQRDNSTKGPRSFYYFDPKIENKLLSKEEFTLAKLRLLQHKKEREERFSRIRHEQQKLEEQIKLQNEQERQRQAILLHRKEQEKQRRIVQIKQRLQERKIEMEINKQRLYTKSSSSG
jgi:hypothetical protein